MKPGEKIKDVSAIAAQVVSITLPDGLPEKRIYHNYEGSTTYILNTEQAVSLYNNLVTALFS